MQTSNCLICVLPASLDTCVQALVFEWKGSGDCLWQYLTGHLLQVQGETEARCNQQALMICALISQPTRGLSRTSHAGPFPLSLLTLIAHSSPGTCFPGQGRGVSQPQPGDPAELRQARCCQKVELQEDSTGWGPA